MSKPNILFLLLDSFRADKCHGSDKTSITPNIDSLIRNGVYFSQTISSADATYLSVGSIFTALYAFKTGLGVNGKHYSKLHSNVTNYINILKNYGYHAYATVPKVLGARSLYSDFENEDKTYDIIPTYTRLSEGLGQKILEMLESGNMKEPWIYYVHILDLHGQFVIPKEFDNEKFGYSKYERMVSVIDIWIGRILQKINLSNTLIVLSADHGCHVPYVHTHNKTINFEENGLKLEIPSTLRSKIPSFVEPLKAKLYLTLLRIKRQITLKKIKNMKLTPYEERNLLSIYRGNNFRVLYDELVHVPLIFAGYGVTHNITISQQVRSIDIFPTISEMIELPKRNEELDGKSLFPFFHGKRFNELPAYMQSFFPIRKASSYAIGIRTSEYKYVRSVNNPKKNVFLYDLKNDPLEERNIANSRQDIIEKMEKILIEIKSEINLENEQNKMSYEETKKVEQELKKLGYI